MPVETANFINDLVATNPTQTDKKSEGDNHLRLIKQTLQNTFSGFTGAALIAGLESQGVDENEYVVSTTAPITAYTDSMIIGFTTTHANSGATTIKINSLSAVPLRTTKGSDFESGDIAIGTVILATWNGSFFATITSQEKANRHGETYDGTHNFDAATIQSTQLDTKFATKADHAGQTYTGTHDFTLANIVSPELVFTESGTANNLTLTGTPRATQPNLSSNDDQVATTSFVNQVAFNTVLPAQSGMPAIATSDGSTVSWKQNNSVLMFIAGF